MDDPRLDDLESRLSDFDGLGRFVLRFSLRTVALLAQQYYASRVEGRLAAATTRQERRDAHVYALAATEAAMKQFREPFGAEAWAFIWDSIAKAMEDSFEEAYLKPLGDQAD